MTLGIFKRFRCPHVDVRGIYGDEINHVGGYRLQCFDCGAFLDGPASIAVQRQRALKLKARYSDEAD